MSAQKLSFDGSPVSLPLKTGIAVIFGAQYMTVNWLNEYESMP
jgi:hypothetical protein